MIQRGKGNGPNLFLSGGNDTNLFLCSGNRVGNERVLIQKKNKKNVDPNHCVTAGSVCLYVFFTQYDSETLTLSREVSYETNVAK